MDRWTGGQLDRWARGTCGQVNRWTGGQLDSWARGTCGQVGQVDRGPGGQMDR